ncbi:hypothetical protein GLOIN_2v1773788 [Rhizophagus clarus]|nr:hypothetical protein GLOIN_2v1773788 [Rhizophagus clarus]
MAFQNSNQPPHKIFKTTQEPEKHFGGTPKQTHKIEKVENKAEPTKPTATTSEFSSGYVSSHISVGETITSNPLRETHNGNGLQTHDGRQFTSSTRPSSLISPILDDSQANDSDGETPRPLSSDYDISSFAGYASAGCPGVSSSSEISGCGISLSDDTTIPNSQMQRESSSPAFSRPSPLKISSILNDPSGGGNASGPLPDNDCPGFPGPSGISGGGVSPSNAFTLISNSDGE